MSVRVHEFGMNVFSKKYKLIFTEEWLKEGVEFKASIANKTVVKEMEEYARMAEARMLYGKP